MNPWWERDDDERRLAGGGKHRRDVVAGRAFRSPATRRLGREPVHRRPADAVRRDPRDVRAGTEISEFPVNSAILRPSPSDVVAAGIVRVSGWATGTGGRPLACVELSTNGGADRVPVRVAASRGHATWASWHVDLELEPGTHTLVVRALDVGGAAQPAELADTWNVKGYCNNAWHRVTVRVG